MKKVYEEENMAPLGHNEYWAIVDKAGRLYMKYAELDASPLYVGKERALAESILKIEAISRLNDRFEELSPGIAKIKFRLLNK